MSIYYNERGYMKLLSHIMENGVDIPDRTGVGCRAIFDAKLVYEVGKQFPFSTIRTAGTRLAFEEFWFFLNGKTQTKELEEKGIFFWNGNTTRDFLDNRGLEDLPEGDMGRAYGFQLRQFGGDTDQIANTINLLGDDKYSRRILNTMWNPNESHLMALTPCHHTHQFVVLPDKNGHDTLHLKLINRSLDTTFGLLFAVQQYAIYLKVVAKMFDFKVGNLSVDLTHVHIYANQFDYVAEILTRDFGTAGTLDIVKDVKTLEDLLTLKWEDILIEGLEVNTSPIRTPRPPMAA